MAVLTQQLCCSSNIKAICVSPPSSASASLKLSIISPSCSSRVVYLRSSFCSTVAPLAREFSFARLSPNFKANLRAPIRRGSVSCVQQQEQELPAKLQEIVNLFRAVPDSKQKYEQLLYYAKQLKPLSKEFLTKENKVEGCVSQVWVKPSLTDNYRVYFEADSDSLLTKGLAALLVEGLSGATVSEILKVTPEFIQMLGLKQSLTPSRSNGFLNMLKLMQKKTLNLYMEAEAAKSGSASSAREISSRVDDPVKTNFEVAHQVEFAKSKSFISVVAGENMSKKDSIQKKLQEALAPAVLEVDDVSHQHAGHAGVHKGATETHFNVKVVSDKFAGTSLIKRHRLIYDLLDEELKNGVHALSLVTKTPKEIGQ